ncbi:protein regulator of cytokinesis 1 [Musca domestica]|uniref:Protein regulator of cytokinesis 1 n=1 Tax=Musca domestica TaxID=7370 RepID=A0A1I8M730_MUSDO|nr:protein regulator of cytokinesis 1 [Musca domestica]
MANYEKECKEMQFLTHKYVGEITKIWEQLFEQDVCRENLRKLVEHANNFYKELVEESLTRKSYIEGEINDLKREAENLKRLLNVDVELPTYDMENVPLLRVQSELDKSLEDLREQLRLRKDQICELLLEQEALCEELGEPPRALLADPLPTAEEIEEFRQHLERLREERSERLNRVSTMRRDIKNFLQILDLQVNTETEDRLLNHREIPMNKETFNGLKRMYDTFGSQVQELRETIDGMRNKISTLWDRLQTSPNTRHKFNRYKDYNQHTYDVFYSELQRCEQLKSQNIKLYVQQIRDEISVWWDKCLKSDKQRERFSAFTSSCYTDDLLDLHELELADCKHHYETNKQIYDLFADRNILWDRMAALEAKASEPGRYNNRGGQLLKEEKERKTIATKLPKIEQQISDLVREYEEREHSPFLVYGENIIEYMAKQWDRKRKDKEQLQSARKNASKTPGPSATKTNTTMRTPMSLKNATSMSSLRKTPSTTNLSSQPALSAQKRRLPTDRATPMAKRSLMQALNSPSVFLKPSTTKNTGQQSKLLGSASKVSTFKSPMKKTKIIGTTIRRRSGRQSNGLKKRRSINKNSSMTKNVPRIVVQECHSSDGYTTDYNGDDTYDSFQKCIEPASRSSIIQGIGHHSSSSSSSNTTRTRRMQQVVMDENARLAKLPRPRPPPSRTPSKQNATHHGSITNLARTPTNTHHHSPVSCSTGRKLTTKNLPIII